MELGSGLWWRSRRESRKTERERAACGFGHVLECALCWRRPLWRLSRRHSPQRPLLASSMFNVREVRVCSRTQQTVCSAAVLVQTLGSVRHVTRFHVQVMLSAELMNQLNRASDARLCLLAAKRGPDAREASARYCWTLRGTCRHTCWTDDNPRATTVFALLCRLTCFCCCRDVESSRIFVCLLSI